LSQLLTLKVPVLFYLFL